MEWHHIWQNCGCPPSGYVFDIRKLSRHNYHQQIKLAHRNKAKIKVEKVVNSDIEKPNSGFWKEINKYRGKKRCIAPTVEGLTNHTEIFYCFADTYNELFNFVGYDVNDMNTLFYEVCGDAVDDYTVHSILMSIDDITSAIKKLKLGKSDGYDWLSSDY